MCDLWGIMATGDTLRCCGGLSMVTSQFTTRVCPFLTLSATLSASWAITSLLNVEDCGPFYGGRHLFSRPGAPHVGWAALLCILHQCWHRGVVEGKALWAHAATPCGRALLRRWNLEDTPVPGPVVQFWLGYLGSYPRHLVFSS